MEGETGQFLITNTVSEKESMLKDLQHSMLKGNVVGIFTGQQNHVLYLTAVEDIIRLESGKHIIVLKRLDLQGLFLHQNHIALDEINKVRKFNALYDDRLPATVKRLAYDIEKEYPIKIRKRETVIPFEDLEVIIIRNIDSGHRLDIRVYDDLIYEKCYVKDFHPKKNMVEVSCGIEHGQRNEIPLFLIKSIQFESFFNFKGMLSKIFMIDRRGIYRASTVL